jgi:putative ABC transport system ATP-binding protein
MSPRVAASDPRAVVGGVSIEALRIERGARTVLEVPALDLEAAAQGAVVGPSGCGKTTLLSVLAGLLPVREGRVTVAGADLAALARQGPRALDRFRAAHVGLVPQQPLLFGVLDVLDNVLAAQHFAGRAADRVAARALLERLDLGGLERRRPRELSRGQQQRVALARALVNRPALILADEPTANLDDANAAQALALLADRAREAGATLLIATHDARVRERFAVVLALPGPAGAPARSR